MIFTNPATPSQRTRKAADSILKDLKAQMFDMPVAQVRAIEKARDAAHEAVKDQNGTASFALLWAAVDRINGTHS